jgi:hypothetical protein
MKEFTETWMECSKKMLEDSANSEICQRNIKEFQELEDKSISYSDFLLNNIVVSLTK